MQDKYVYMQLIYVDMRDKYVDMQPPKRRRTKSAEVNCRLKTCDKLSTRYVILFILVRTIAIVDNSISIVYILNSTFSIVINVKYIIISTDPLPLFCHVCNDFLFNRFCKWNTELKTIFPSLISKNECGVDLCSLVKF